MEIFDFTLNLSIAILAGLVIGFERQWHHKSAGLRTHALVAAGSAAFVLLSDGLIVTEQGDITRVIGQIVVGIGFLGAGLIIRNGTSIQGLNSAATIWCSSAIGCFAGAGWYLETLIFTGMLLIINLVFRKIENTLDKKHDPQVQ
jgi:putative Mg2+ transporter-C (MgtC) family protein